jgi:hypothetical protein
MEDEHYEEYGDGDGDEDSFANDDYLEERSRSRRPSKEGEARSRRLSKEGEARSRRPSKETTEEPSAAAVVATPPLISSRPSTPRAAATATSSAEPDPLPPLLPLTPAPVPAPDAQPAEGAKLAQLESIVAAPEPDVAAYSAAPTRALEHRRRSRTRGRDAFGAAAYGAAPTRALKQGHDAPDGRQDSACGRGESAGAAGGARARPGPGVAASGGHRGARHGFD